MSRPTTILTLATLLSAAALHADVDPDRLAGLKARNLGPAGMSGRIAVIDAVASNPDLVWAGAATGGVWRSDNGGLTWKPVFDDQPVHSVGALAIFQPNPEVVWVGTGEGNLRNSASVGNGVYRTLDGGKTWTHLGLDKTERIYRIRLHPQDPDVAYVCAPGQEWGENADRGVFKTEDGGKSWKKVLYVDEKTGCGDLAIDPVNPGKLIASMWQFRRWPWFFNSGGPGSGVYVTHDGGVTWKKLQQEDGLPKGDLGRVHVAIAPSDPSVVYALVEAQKSALIRSEDGGKSWKTVNDKPNVALRPFYFSELRVDPAWPYRLYVLQYVVRVSNDGGKTLEQLKGAGWRDIHVDYHAMWIAPHDPERIYTGNDGGVAESRDRGKTFRFVSNLPLAQFYHVSVDDERPYNVYGGLQDNDSWRGPSQVWQRGGIRNYMWLPVGSGDGFETLPHPKQPGVGYSMWQGGNLMRFDVATGETRIVKPAPPDTKTRLRFNWNAGLATDPFEPDTVYLGSQFLHRSADRGETWSVISPDLTTNKPEWQKQDETGGLTPDVSDAENFTTILSIAPSPVEKGTIWVGTDDGRLHVTRDGGKSWAALEKNVKGVPENTWIPHLEASHFDAGTAFAVFDNHRRSDWTPYLYRTDDFGKTWTSLATPAVRGYALVLRQDVVKKDLLFLGTEFGLYVSWDGGKKWTPLKKTLPTASVMDLAIQPREHDLVIGTHGRALWILDDLRPLRAMTEAALDEPLRVYEMGDAQQYWQKGEEGGFGFGAGEFRGENRAYGGIITYSLNLPGLPLHDEEKERARKEQERQQKRTTEAAKKEPEKKQKKEEEPKVEIQVADGSGKPIRTFKGPAHLGVNRAAWDLRGDAFKEAPRDPEAPPREEEPAGPEVPPGSYTITVKYGDHSGKQTVKVVADPRSKNTPADWARRFEAIQKAGALSDRAVLAIWRIRRTREDVAAVQAKVRTAAEDAGEKDKGALDALPLVKAGDTLSEALTELEKKLWVSYEAKGIQPERDVAAKIWEASGYLESSWDPPSPTQLEHLKQAEARFEAFKHDYDTLFETEVAAFREQAEQAKIGLLAW